MAYLGSFARYKASKSESLALTVQGHSKSNLMMQLYNYIIYNVYIIYIIQILYNFLLMSNSMYMSISHRLAVENAPQSGIIRRGVTRGLAALTLCRPRARCIQVMFMFKVAEVTYIKSGVNISNLGRIPKR